MFLVQLTVLFSSSSCITPLTPPPLFIALSPPPPRSLTLGSPLLPFFRLSGTHEPSFPLSLRYCLFPSLLSRFSSLLTCSQRRFIMIFRLMFIFFSFKITLVNHESVFFLHFCQFKFLPSVIFSFSRMCIFYSYIPCFCFSLLSPAGLHFLFSLFFLLPLSRHIYSRVSSPANFLSRVPGQHEARRRVGVGGGGC